MAGYFGLNLNAWLKKAGLNGDQLSSTNKKEAERVLKEIDAADGVADGNVNIEDFISGLQQNLSKDSINMDAINDEYLDAWEAWKGNEENPSGQVNEENPSAPVNGENPPEQEGAVNPEQQPNGADAGSVNGASGQNPGSDPAQNTNNYERKYTDAVSPESLKGKDSSTLRNDRSSLLSEIDSIQGEMESAKEEKQSEVDEKKQAYDEAMEAMKEENTIEDENGNTMQELNEQKTAKEGEIQQQNTVIQEVNSSITTQKSEISSIEGEISSHNASKPNQSDYTKTVVENGEEKEVPDTEAYNTALNEWEEKLESLEAQKNEAEDKLSQLEQQLGQEENTLKTLQTEATEIDNQISQLAMKIQSDETMADQATQQAAETLSNALNEYQTAQSELASITEPYEADISQIRNDLSTYDDAIKESEKLEKEDEASVLNGDMPIVEDTPLMFGDMPIVQDVTKEEATRELYEELNLEKEGMSFEVFSMAMEVYNNAEDKSSSDYFGIFDTTQSDDAKRYYLINMAERKIETRSEMYTGKKGFGDSIEGANKNNSNATLVGLLKFSGKEGEYGTNNTGMLYEDRLDKKGNPVKNTPKDKFILDGQEEGINDKARERQVVGHAADIGKTHSLGCPSFPPILKDNGTVDVEKTNARAKELYRPDQYIFIFPTGREDAYQELSDLY